MKQLFKVVIIHNITILTFGQINIALVNIREYLTNSSVHRNAFVSSLAKFHTFLNDWHIDCLRANSYGQKATTFLF